MANQNNSIDFFQTEFSKDKWESIGMTFPFVYGYLSFVSTVPSILSPGEWLLVFCEEIEFDPESPLGREFQKLSIHFYNVLRKEMLEGKLHFPTLLLNPDRPQIGVENPLGQWSLGFSLGVQEFGHLWKIACTQNFKNNATEESPIEKTKAQWILFEMFRSEKTVAAVAASLERTEDMAELVREIQQKLPSMWKSYCVWFLELWKAFKLSEKTKVKL